MNPLEAAETTRLMIFSHPNHELAIYGTISRLRPHLVFLTDGGGEDRVAATRRGLEAIDRLDRAHFLNHTESSFYDAILERDTGFFRQVAEQVAHIAEAVQPDQVFCDAIEFYNPVHDIALPVTLAALGCRPGASFFEIPLIYQKPVEGERFEVQRLPGSRRECVVELKLTSTELRGKMRALHEVYTTLTRDLGDVLFDLPEAAVAVEQVAQARKDVPLPLTDQELRYDRRGELLLAQGLFERAINYADHYVPIASALMTR